MAEKRVKVRLNNPPPDRPNYQMQWDDPVTGKVRTESAGTSDLAVAEAKKTDKEYELNHGVVRPGGKGQPAALSWADFRKLYESERLAGLSANTRRLAKVALDKVERFAAPGALAAVDEDALARLAAGMRARKNTPRTVLGNLSIVRAALRWAKRRKLIAAVPHIDMPPVPDPGPPERVIDAAGYAALRTRLEGPWRLFLDVGWYAGMRMGEIRALAWSREPGCPWVDWPAERIAFAPDSNKSGRSQWVELHPRLKAILRPLRAEAGPVVGVPGGLGYVCRRFKELCAAAGFDFRTHDMRRSFASRYASVIQVPQLQRLMRHANIATTARYVNVDPSLRAAIRAC